MSTNASIFINQFTKMCIFNYVCTNGHMFWLILHFYKQLLPWKIIFKNSSQFYFKIQCQDNNKK